MMNLSDIFILSEEKAYRSVIADQVELNVTCLSVAIKGSPYLSTTSMLNGEWKIFLYNISYRGGEILIHFHKIDISKIVTWQNDTRLKEKEN